MKRILVIISSIVILFVGWKIFTSDDNVEVEKVSVEQKSLEKESIEEVKKNLQKNLESSYAEPTLGIGGEEQAMSKFERSLGAMSEEEEVPPVLNIKKIELTQVDVKKVVPEIKVVKPIESLAIPKIEKIEEKAPMSMSDLAAKPTDAFENALVDEADEVVAMAPQKEVTIASGALSGIISSETQKEIKNLPTPKLNLKGKKLRDRLKNLLAEAEKTIDNDKEILPKNESLGANAVSVKPKKSKELLYDLVSMAMNSGTKEDTTYVTGLLSEVTKAKITVVQVTDKFTTIRVKTGDTLWKMASKFYGDGFKYKVIFQANRKVIKNPSLISPGMIIKIPKLKK